MDERMTTVRIMSAELNEMLVPYLEGTCPSSLEPAVVEAIRSVYDPEIPVSVFDLGLIYEAGSSMPLQRLMGSARSRWNSCGSLSGNRNI
jgi:hypothetical protein